jgi:hypothetical protein
MCRRARHPSASARRAYAAGLAGKRHNSVQPAGIATDPEEATGEHAAIEKRSKLLLGEAWHEYFWFPNLQHTNTDHENENFGASP